MEHKSKNVLIGLGVFIMLGWIATRNDKPSAQQDAGESKNTQAQWYQLNKDEPNCILAVGKKSIESVMKRHPGCIKRVPAANQNLVILNCSKTSLGGNMVYAPSFDECKETQEFLKRENGESP